MGVVYRAQDPAIGRTVAIKTIRLSDFSDPAENSRLRDRLFREAQSAGILSHPGIVTIYDIAEEGGFAYIFMEYVSGPTLEKILSDPIPPKQDFVIDTLRQVAAALDYAHKKGIVHRDIKPANIMVHEDGTPKIADFGVAKMLSQNMTQVGAIMGTPNYMAPEQVQGKPVDGRADQFSLAVIAYEILTGEKPFAAESLPTLLFKLVAEDPPLPHRINPTLPKEVNPVILKAMAKTNTGRYANCLEFIAALELALVNRPDWQPMTAGTSQSIPTAAPTNIPTGQHQTATQPQPRVAPPAPPMVNTPLPGTMRQPVTPPPPPPPPQPQVQVPIVPGPPPPRVQPQQPKSNNGMKTLVAALFSIIVVGGLIFGLLSLLERKKNAETPIQQPEQPPAAEAEKKPSPSGKKDSDNQSGGTTPPAPADRPEATLPAVRRETENSPATPLSKGDYVVRVNTNPPGAKVVFDTSQSCTSPCIYELPVGRHTISTVLDGYGTAFRIFELPRDSTVNIDLPKPSGTLMISSTPSGASIFIDGQERSEKTPAVIKLPVGRVKLRVTKEGLAAKETTVEIKDGGNPEIHINWE